MLAVGVNRPYRNLNGGTTVAIVNDVEKALLRVVLRKVATMPHGET
jgi:hypothetical protein